MPEPVLFAVHLDGALVTRDMLRGDDLAEILDLLPEGRDDAAYKDPASAGLVAVMLKEALPDELVTIVVWNPR